MINDKDKNIEAQIGARKDRHIEIDLSRSIGL